MKYCSNCGAILSFRIPRGDDRPRHVCDACKSIHYQNPKLVVGCIAQWEDRVLFCRRAIEPRYGKWTIPAGFMENGETVTEGAERETYEEARAKVKDLKPYVLYDLTFISQVYLIFRGKLMDLDFSPGEETLEVKLFREQEVPWGELAFPVVRQTLRLYFQDLPAGVFPFHIGSIKRR